MRKAQIRTLLLVIAAMLLMAAVYIAFKNLQEPSDVRQSDDICATCSKDCPCQDGEICSFGACIKGCGDGICGRSEDWKRCPADCAKPVDSGTVNYTTQPVQPVCPAGGCAASACGNGICESGEDCTCSDCACATDRSCDSILKKCVKISSCGDGLCQGTDNCDNCPRDCPCAMGSYCDRIKLQCTEPVCGNGVCEAFENQENCCDDCSCTTNYMVCAEHQCQYPSPAITNDEAERLAISYLKKKGLTVTSTVEIRNFVWNDELVKKVKFQTVEQQAYCIVVVNDKGEVEMLVTY